MLDRLLRGYLMEAAGDSGGGVAIAEPSSDFGGDAGGSSGDTPDASATGTEVHDAEFVDPGSEAQPAAESTALVKAGERAVQNGKITPSGRAALEAVAQLSPALKQEVIQSLLVRDWFRREFPGGKKDIQALKSLAEQANGEQGLSEMREIVEGHNALDEKYIAGDPAFISEITFSPEGQQGFVKVMPAAMERFKELAPQHFAYHQAKNFAHFMDQARLPVIAARLVDLLDRAAAYQKSGNNELAASFVGEITQAYNEVANVLSKVYEVAGKQPPDVGGAKDPALDDRARQLSEREKGLQKQEWGFSVSTERKRIFSKAWAEVTKGRNLNSDQEETVKGFYELRMQAKIRNWKNQGERFLANGDKDGYLREQYGFFQKAIPEALRQAIQQALPGKPGPKPTATTGKPAASAQRQPQNGKSAVRVAKMPPTSELDSIRTTSEMLSNNQAFKKDGTIVQWA